MRIEVQLNDLEKSIINLMTADHHPRSFKDYTRELNAFRKYIDKELMAASDQDGSAYLDFLRKEKKAAGTIARIYDQLNNFYNFIFREGYISANPFTKITRPKASKQVKPERTPTPEELEKLFIVLQKEASIRDSAAILLILTTGLKVSRALRVLWNDFIPAADYTALKVHTTPPRYIRIYDFVWEVICKYRLYEGIPESYMQKNYYAFVSSRELEKNQLHPEQMRPITPDWIRKVLEDACERAELPLYTSKDLRHAFVVYMLNMGADPKALADQVDLKNPYEFVRYEGLIEQLINPAGKYGEQFFEKILRK